MTEDLPIYFLMKPVEEDWCHFSEVAVTMKEGIEIVNATPGILLIEISKGSSAIAKNQRIEIHPVYNPHRILLKPERA